MYSACLRKMLTPVSGGLENSCRLARTAVRIRPKHREEIMVPELANHRTLTLAVLVAVILALPKGARAQTNYAAEAAKNPGAAYRPTPHLADGHPDLNGVWHHFFGIGTIQKVGDSFVVGGAFGAKQAKLYATPLRDPKP